MDTSTEEKLTTLAEKVKAIEAWKHETDIAMAIADERYTNIVATLLGIEAGVNYIFMTLGAVLLAGIGNFVLKGGLHQKHKSE